MEKILIFIKHNFSFLWNIIEWGNGIFFFLFYQRRLDKVLPQVFEESTNPLFTYKRLDITCTQALYELIKSQEVSDLEYFHPHKFDITSIRKQIKNLSFLTMGAFDGGKMVGYFFLRFFSNKRCFVGRMIDKNHRGRGIGSMMNYIMYETAWRMGFRCLSTISRNNKAVMHAHALNPNMIVLKELPNDYLLVEFVRHNTTQSG